MSVKCGLLTDKSAKIGSLSVNLSEILADCPKNKKYPTIIRLLCLTIIGHFIMARIFIIIQLRTGSCLLASAPCPNQVPARIPPIASKDSLDEASSPSVAQSFAYGVMTARFHTLLKNYSHSKPYSCEGCLDCGLLNIRSSCRSTAKQAVQVQESGCLLRLQDI